MIDRSFRVLARGPVPTEDAVLLAVELGASSDHQTLVPGGADIELEHESGLDVRIWSPDGLVEMNEAHQVQTRLGSGLAVGDADGRCLVERPDGIFAVGWGATDPSELRLVTPDLNSMLNGELGVLSPSG